MRLKVGVGSVRVGGVIDGVIIWVLLWVRIDVGVGWGRAHETVSTCWVGLTQEWGRSWVRVQVGSDLVELVLVLGSVS